MIKQEPTLHYFKRKLGKDIDKKSNRPEIVYKRYAAFLFLREKFGFTYKEIGMIFGKNTTSVSYGIKEMQAKLSINDSLALRFWNKLEK